MQMKVTVQGLLQFNPNLFDGLSVPDGVSRDDTIFSILEKCGDFGVIYPNPDFMQMVIGVWSRNSAEEWKRLQATVTAEYNPLDNYDRTEEITRDLTDSRRDTLERSSESETSESGTTGTDETVSTTNSNTTTNNLTDSSSGSREEYQTAYDSQQARTTGRAEETGSATHTGTVTDSGTGSTTTDGTVTTSGSNTGTISESGTGISTGTEKETTKVRAHGNIGVTTPFQMLSGERDIVKFNLPDYIAQSFADRFCIQIY